MKPGWAERLGSPQITVLPIPICTEYFIQYFKNYAAHIWERGKVLHWEGCGSAVNRYKVHPNGLHNCWNIVLPCFSVFIFHMRVVWKDMGFSASLDGSRQMSCFKSHLNCVWSTSRLQLSSLDPRNTDIGTIWFVRCHHWMTVKLSLPWLPC